MSTIHACFGLARVHLAADRLDEAAAAVERAGPLVASLPLPGLAETLLGLRGVLTWRRGPTRPWASSCLTRPSACSQHQLFQDTVPFLYDLRDLYHARKDTGRAVAVMARRWTSSARAARRRGRRGGEMAALGGLAGPDPAGPGAPLPHLPGGQHPDGEALGPPVPASAADGTVQRHPQLHLAVGENRPQRRSWTCSTSGSRRRRERSSSMAAWWTSSSATR